MGAGELETMTLTFNAFAGQGKTYRSSYRRPFTLGLKQLAQRLHAHIPAAVATSLSLAAKGCIGLGFKVSMIWPSATAPCKSVNLGELS
jgi:hypothetical protein